MIAGLQQVKTKNSSSSDSNQNDWVSIVTFDKVAGTVVRLGLTSNYDSAMQSCTTMQAVGNNGNSTATETGLIAAYNLIKPQSQGGTGREHTQKIVVLLTDGIANLKSSSNTTISNYVTAHPSSNYYGGSSDYPSDAAMMQVDTMRPANGRFLRWPWASLPITTSWIAWPAWGALPTIMVMHQRPVATLPTMKPR